MIRANIANFVVQPVHAANDLQATLLSPPTFINLRGKGRFDLSFILKQLFFGSLIFSKVTTD